MKDSYEAIVHVYFQGAAGFWDDIYRQPGVYALIHQERRERILRMVSALKLPPGARLLEVGCGAGHMAVHLASLGYDVTAVDTAAAMVAATTKRAQEAGVGERLSVSLGEIQGLQFPESSFDLVLAAGVLPWVDRVDAALAEMGRVVRPGGKVLTTMDNRWAVHRTLDPRLNPLAIPVKRFLAGILSAGGLTGVKARARTMSIREFRRRLRGAGLREREVMTLGFGPFTVWNWGLFNHQAGASLHRRLQERANKEGGWLSSAGAQCIVLAEREIKQGKKKSNHE